MARRRLIVVVSALALVIGGVASWASADRLTAEERALVGTWRLAPGASGGSATWVFGPDRRSYICLRGPADSEDADEIVQSGRWSMQDGVIVVDGEDSLARRALRPVLRLLRRPVARVERFTASVTADGLVLTGADDSRQVWTRTPAD
jgi:hypothetical protein